MRDLGQNQRLDRPDEVARALHHSIRSGFDQVLVFAKSPSHADTGQAMGLRRPNIEDGVSDHDAMRRADLLRDPDVLDQVRLVGVEPIQLGSIDRFEKVIEAKMIDDLPGDAFRFSRADEEIESPSAKVLQHLGNSLDDLGLELASFVEVPPVQPHSLFDPSGIRGVQKHSHGLAERGPDEPDQFLVGRYLLPEFSESKMQAGEEPGPWIGQGSVQIEEKRVIGHRQKVELIKRNSTSSVAEMAEDPFPFPNEVYPEDWFTELALEDLFEDASRPFEIDLGCGDGSFLVAMAAHYPDRNFLGVERLLGRCRKVWKKAEREGLENVRILRIDTNYGVQWLLPRTKAFRIHFLCPDPWPKKKHASRRQMCRENFLSACHQLLTGGGEFLFKTDSLEYFEEAREFQECYPLFRELPWEDDAFFYPTTDFEEQWLAEGRVMNRMRLGKVPGL